jgi:hypothetical protein
MGSERNRIPIASAIALAIAGAVGIIGGSPSPFAPMPFASMSESSIKLLSILGTSRAVGRT